MNFSNHTLINTNLFGLCQYLLLIVPFSVLVVVSSIVGTIGMSRNVQNISLDIL